VQFVLKKTKLHLQYKVTGQPNPRTSHISPLHRYGSIEELQHNGRHCGQHHRGGSINGMSWNCKPSTFDMHAAESARWIRTTRTTRAQGTRRTAPVFPPGSMTMYSRTVCIELPSSPFLPHAKAEFEGRRYHSYFGTEKNLLPTDEVRMNSP
jgi:hypothetical protein